MESLLPLLAQYPGWGLLLLTWLFSVLLVLRYTFLRALEIVLVERVQAMYLDDDEDEDEGDVEVDIPSGDYYDGYDVADGRESA